MRNKNRKPKTNAEIYAGIRRDWGNVKPYTRVEESKKHKKPKHKGREWDE